MLVAVPREGVEGGLKVLGCKVGVVEQEVPAELAPAQFAQEFLDAAGKARLSSGGESRGVPDLPRADLAKAQMRREP